MTLTHVLLLFLFLRKFIDKQNNSKKKKRKKVLFMTYGQHSCLCYKYHDKTDNNRCDNAKNICNYLQKKKIIKNNNNNKRIEPIITNSYPLILRIFFFLFYFITLGNCFIIYIFHLNCGFFLDRKILFIERNCVFKNKYEWEMKCVSLNKCFLFFIFFYCISIE